MARLRGMVVVVGGLAATAGSLIFCVGEDPAATVVAREGEEGGRCYPNASCKGSLSCVGGYCVRAEDAATPDGGAATGGDGGPDAEAGGACGPIPTWPCGCTGEGCCLESGGRCVNLGTGVCNAPLLRCAGRNTCSPDNNACCFHGKVVAGAGTACPTFGIHDSECASGPDGGNPCIDSEVLCTADADCALVDAGTCHSGQIAGTSRIIGFCRRL